MKKTRVKIGRKKMTDEEFEKLFKKQNRLWELHQNETDENEKANRLADLERDFYKWHYECIFRQTGMNKEQWKKHCNEKGEGEEWKN